MIQLKDILIAKVSEHIASFPHSADAYHQVIEIVNSCWEQTAARDANYLPLVELIKRVFQMLGVELYSEAYWSSPVSQFFCSHIVSADVIEMKCPADILVEAFQEFDDQFQLNQFLDMQYQLLPNDTSTVAIWRQQLIDLLEEGPAKDIAVNSTFGSAYMGKGVTAAFQQDALIDVWLAEMRDAPFDPEQFLRYQQQLLNVAQSLNERKRHEAYINLVRGYMQQSNSSDWSYSNCISMIAAHNQCSAKLLTAEFARLYWLIKVDSNLSLSTIQGERYRFAEHVALGLRVRIAKYTQSVDGRSSLVEIEHGLPLSRIGGKVGERELFAIEGEALLYPEGVGLGGDFYGKDIIAEGENLNERRKLFVTSFNTMMKSGVTSERDAILDITSKNHGPVAETIRLVKLLGMQYQKLLRYNADHFAPHAWLAYEAGHAEAISLALRSYQLRQAGQNEGADQFIYSAYLVNAVACHYLSDNFAGGHIRVPRAHLIKRFGSFLGGLLSRSMHDEDCAKGVNVANADGAEWVAYGDGKYFDPCNCDNAMILHSAMQASADEVLHAYVRGTEPLESVKKFVPKPLQPGVAFKFGDMPNQSYPLFRVNEQSEALEVRADVEDRSCRAYEPLNYKAISKKFKGVSIQNGLVRFFNVVCSGDSDFSELAGRECPPVSYLANGM